MANQTPLKSSVLGYEVRIYPNARGNFWRCDVTGERLSFFGGSPAEAKYKAFLYLGGDA